MKFLKDERAQGSIELLLLVAVAITVAAIVGIILKQTAAGMGQEANTEAAKAE